ncbi:hypothetical protein [Saccharophagus degradans]|uniref:PsbP C-terminal domain-containing protein n=1 Tax=Saccharophagus degradans (strain 2-40 / ATCC 43961 / DSM 17024) TaxID=203122 RepID=Q21DW4_SACD2|nr:hypothetical protein [Saccharophagus degradans]ABD83115.1 hypothetical protein Sde_3860 [Saccharophagus degradans 2-40]
MNNFTQQTEKEWWILTFLPKTAFFVFLVLIVPQIVSCSKAPSPQTKIYEQLEYANNGISFSYPSHWKLAHDESPGLYSDREVSLDISDFSSVTIRIFYTEGAQNQEQYGLTRYTERVINGLGLLNTPSFKNLHQQPTTLNNHKGYKVNWIDTLVGNDKYELTVLKYETQENQVFIVLYTSNEDIQESDDLFKTFIQSLNIHF